MSKEKVHHQEKYLNLKTKKHEYFIFIGEHIYRRISDNKEFKVMDLRRDYKFVSTHKGFQNQQWEHNPVNGFNIRKA